MTVLKKLAEIGPKCSCGGIVGYADQILCCMDCGGGTCKHVTELEAYTAWFVQCGGPIPREIAPKIHHTVLVEQHDGWPEVASTTSRGSWVVINGSYISYISPPHHWYFIDRTPEKIRVFLESEVVE